MKKFYITTSIIYTNAPPHIGAALEFIQADVLARYHRLLGEDVLFSTGTDEHGMKNAQAAKQAGKTPEKFTEEISQEVKSLTKVLNLSNDDFIRTTDKKRHWPTVKKVWLKLKENGDIYKKKYKGLYCVGCESFIKEKDLVNGKCPIHKKAPEIIEEKNYFFRLSKYQNQIKKIVENSEIKIIPETRRNELLSFINRGLEDVSCSRPKEKLEWGIPIPRDNTQRVYVWLEALVNYLSVVDYAANGDRFKKFWPPDVHCIGKDIFIRFHGSLWLAVISSLGLELPKAVFVHGFITVNGQKMSKSLGNVIDPFELVEKYGTDAVRYYLLREIPSVEDGDFTYEKFEARYNSDLASGIGNLLARVSAMADKLKIKKLKIDLKLKIKNLKLENKIKKTKSSYKKNLENFKFNEALKCIWDLISFCDKYIEKERPWENENQELRSKNQGVINNLLVILDNIAEMLKPFLPETSEKIKKRTVPLFPRII